MKDDWCLLSKEKLQKEKSVTEPLTQTIIKRAKRFVISLGNQQDEITGVFKTNIKKIIQEVQSNPKKKILYTTVEEDLDYGNIAELEELLEQVPSKRKQFLKKYSADKAVKYIKKSKVKVDIKIVVPLGIGGLALQEIAEYWDFLREFLFDIGTSINKFIEWVAKISGYSQRASATMSGITALVIIGSGYCFFSQKQEKSSNPLLVLRFKKLYAYFAMFCIVFLVNGWMISNSDQVNSDTKPNIEILRESIVDIAGTDKTIYVPINSVLEPVGNIKIKQNNSSVYSIEYTETGEMVETTSLDNGVFSEGEKYCIEVKLDLFEKKT